METKPKQKLSFGHLMVWKSSEVGAAWLNMIVLNYLTLYTSDTFGLDVALVGTILLASKLVDAVTDIVAGYLIDNTHTKWGKGRPYELCIIGMAICTVLLFAGKPEWSKTVKLVWIFLMYTLDYSIFATLRLAAQNPYTIRHFNNDREIVGKQAALGGIVVMVGTIIVSMIFPALMAKIATSSAGWSKLVLLFAVPSAALGMVRFIFCKENVEADDEKHEKVRVKEIFDIFKNNGYVWIYGLIVLAYGIITNLSVTSFYFTYIVGDVGKAGILSAMGVIALPVMFLFPVLEKKIGSLGKMIFYFSWIGVLGYALCFFAGSNLALVIVGYLLGTIGTLPVMYYGAVFVMNICNYNEIKGMARMEGSSGILGNFATKVGGAMGSWITGIMLSLGGYISSTADEVVTQPASALMMIRVDFAIVPLILSIVIGFGCLAFSKCEKMSTELEAKKALQATEIE